MFGSDEIGVFFDDFGVDMTFGAVTGKVNLSEPDELAADLGVSRPGVNKTKRAATFPADRFPGLANGNAVTIDGTEYEVRGDPVRIEDGAVLKAILTVKG